MKIWYYIVICTGLVILLQLAGLPTGASSIFNLIGINFNQAVDGSNITIGNVTTSATGFYDRLFSDKGDLKGILTLLAAAAAGVAIGFLTRVSGENLILLPLITTTLVIFLQTFVSIMNYTIGLGQVWASAIIVMLFLPLTIGFILALAEFFRGTD